MKKYLTVFLVFASSALAACDNGSEAPQLKDQQVVCSLKGGAFIFIEGYPRSIHSVRSVESDALCQPLKAIINVKPETGVSQ
jgi:uncharacterized protein YcfL